MRTMIRAAVIRASTAVLGSFLGVSCTLLDAHADDASVRTVEAPPPPHHFGDRGDVVIPVIGVGGGLGAIGANANGLGIGYIGSDDGEGSKTKDAQIFIAPSFDIFIASHVSLGASADFFYFRYANDSQPEPAGNGQLQLGVHPRIGYAIPLGDHTAFWPRLGLGMTGYTNIDSGGSLYPNFPKFTVDVTVDAPIVYAIDRHVYLSVGPTASAASTFGGYTDIGFGTFATAGFVL